MERRSLLPSRSALTSEVAANATIRLGSILAPIGIGVGGAINQDIGAPTQDGDLLLALITPTGRCHRGVVMAEVLSPLAVTSLTLILATGIGLCIAYIFRGWLDKL